MREHCFSFEASGHRFRPLDGALGVCLRLYCQRCGRVVPADQLFNTESWANVDLPAGIRAEFTDPEAPIH